MNELQNTLRQNNDDIHISKDFKLVQSIGGAKLIHARGCDFIKNWDLDGFREIKDFKPNRMKPCPTCGKLVFVTLGAKDYVKNMPRYKALFLHKSVAIETLITFFRDSHSKVQLFNDKLYIHCRKDDWYIDLSLGECHLYHNNYRIRTTDKKERYDAKGFHEHPLKKELQMERLNEALRHISGYRYEEAEKVHAKKSRPKMTFVEYDGEYDPEAWGFRD